MKKSVALKILGLSSPYTEEDIKKAHRQKIRENHPDRFSDPVKKAEAEEQTKLINEARDVLVNRRWDPEYGPRTGTGYGPYGNPYANPFSGYGSPFSQYGPGAGPQGGPFGGAGQNPFGEGFPFDFVWTAWDGTGTGQGAGYNPFDPFFSAFNRKPQKTAAQVMEEEKRSFRLTAAFVAVKLAVLGVCAATGALPVGVSIYALATVLFALYRETSGCSRVLAMALAVFVAPMLLRFVPLFLAASMTPLAIAAMVAAAGYDVFVLRAAFMRYWKAKRKANGGKAE